MALVTIGGKGSSLSPSSIYAIATGLSKIKIDSSILEKLSKSHSKKPNKSSPPSIPPSNSNLKSLLTLEESRAALVVLLNQLLFSDVTVRPVLPLLIEETLNCGFPPETLDFGSSLGLLESILELNGRNLEEFGATGEEIGVLGSSFAVINGICAILDCNCSALVTVVDAVAALSCEAAKADVAAFDMPVSGDGYSVKDETDVASDMKDLVFGSKFVGSVDSDAFSDIPTIHGSFRAAARSVHALMRVELNSGVRVRKTNCGGNGKGKVLVATVLPLAMSLRSVGESSLGRAKLTIGSIDDVELRSRVGEVFEKSCPGLEALRNGFQSVSVKAALESDYMAVLHEIYDLLVKLRTVIAWEAALALFLLEVTELNEKTQVGVLPSVETNGGNENLERRSEKKNRKKKVLGKGTSAIRQLIKDKFPGSQNPADILGVMVEWARELSSFFDPKDPELDTLLKKVKDIVESNEVRRLPKIPKVRATFFFDP